MLVAPTESVTRASQPELFDGDREPAMTTASIGAANIQAFDTLPKLLLRNAKRYRGRPAVREKEYGIWQSWTWSAVLDQVRSFACGLAVLGVRRGDKVAIIGDNRPHLYWAMTAAQALGAIPVPIYQDSVAEEMLYVLDNAEAPFVIAEDQEQIDKLLQVKDRCPRLQAIVYEDPRGLRNYDQPFLHGFTDVQARGREYDTENPDFFLGEIAKSTGSDTAIILYTSGTTGRPKGVVLSFDNLIITAQNAIQRDRITEKEVALAYLPMAWVGDNIFSVAQSYCAGFCVNCPESGATVMHDLREVGPTYFFAPPRIWESILTEVMIRIEDTGWLKRTMFHAFMKVARSAGTRILDGKPVPLRNRFLYALGRVLVYAPLMNTLGFSRIRLAYTAGEAIGPDIFDFYRSLGLNLKQLYGQTEAAVFVTMHPEGEVKPDTVGTPAVGVEVKIAEDGQVMFRGPGVFLEYYKNPEATEATKTPDGWVRSGDAGYFDDDGQLKIIDRVKDVGRLNDGTMFAPKYIENKLKFFANIKEAVAFGDGRDYASALISIDLQAVGNWAERRGIPYGSYQELAAKDEIYDLIEGHIRQVNRDLAADPHLSSSQIKRFLLLHKELDADDAELTRTRKVRRRYIAEKYFAVVKALYSGSDCCDVEAQVTFEDGSTGTLRGKLKIRDVDGFGVKAAQSRPTTPSPRSEQVQRVAAPVPASR
jgi:long-chain acyl-CoA synthetase